MNRIEFTRIVSRGITALLIGAVLVACGAELRFSSLAAGRGSHIATLLPNGKVLVAGGVWLVESSQPVPSCTTRPPGAGA